MSINIEKLLNVEMSVLKSDTALLCLAASAASVNQQDVVTDCTKQFCEHKYELNHLYEALLQTYLFAGFPAALEALSTFATTLNNLSISFSPPKVEEYNVEEFIHRGVESCKSIYTNVYHSMRERLHIISPHLDEWMIVEGYGKMLSRPQLGLRTRELITVAILATTSWERQLYSHLRGAMNVGASEKECLAALKCSLHLCGEEVFLNALSMFQKIQSKQ